MELLKEQSLTYADSPMDKEKPKEQTSGNISSPAAYI